MNITNGFSVAEIMGNHSIGCRFWHLLKSEHLYNKIYASYRLGNTINCLFGNRSYNMWRSLTNETLDDMPEDLFRRDFNQFHLLIDIIRSKIWFSCELWAQFSRPQSLLMRYYWHNEWSSYIHRFISLWFTHSNHWQPFELFAL